MEEEEAAVNLLIRRNTPNTIALEIQAEKMKLLKESMTSNSQFVYAENETEQNLIDDSSFNRSTQKRPYNAPYGKP